MVYLESLKEEIPLYSMKVGMKLSLAVEPKTFKITEMFPQTSTRYLYISIHNCDKIFSMMYIIFPS